MMNNTMFYRKKTALQIAIVLFSISLSACSTPTSTKNILLQSNSEYSEVFEDSGTSYDWRDFDWVSTDESTCFSAIGYDYGAERLAVTFRDSGKTYIYHDVPESVWNDLYYADSRGGFYNSDIKGQYVSERIDK